MITHHTDGQPYVSTHRHVDASFLDDLHVLDSTLEPRWNPARCKWEIWRQGKYILTVQSNSKGYRHLDNRTLIRLFNADTSKYATKYQFIHNLHTDDRRLIDKKRKEQDDFMRNCSDDMAPLMRKRKTVHFDPSKEKQ
jgi:hypothetical protein